MIIYIYILSPHQMKHLHIYQNELIIADVTNYCFPRQHEAKVSVSAGGLSLGEATTLYS